MRLIAVTCWMCLVLALGCGGSGDPSGGTGGTGGAGTGGAGTGGAGTGGAGTGGAGTGGTAGDGGTGGGGTGGDSGTGGTGGIVGTNRVNGDQVCSRLAELQCAAEANCCENAARRFPSVDACINNQRAVCEDNAMVARLAGDAKTGFSSDHTETVFNEFERQTGLCDVNVAAWGVSSEGLLNMFRGTLGANAPCQPMSATDFGAGIACRVDNNLACVPAFPETSVTPPSGWSCKTRSGVGGDCFSDLNCTDGLFCLVPETLSECATRKAPGQSCAAPNECLSLLCEASVCVEANVEDVYCLGG